ncbi:kinesin light chain-like [Paramuricea clavata]|uniref:Kinesin light chain-like n=1 Tax=Paramuricea clavata TaxID=317549 RepID=A0A6S7K1B2_PARCT|nr:kinesin light chain-like [Paramuricea clavata]
MFSKIYNLAIVEAKEQRKFKAVHQLLIAKAVYEITWPDGNTLPLLKEAEQIEKQNPLLTSKVIMGKRMCYHGIHLLIHRAATKGGKILENGISLLSSENTVLKLLSFQILALFGTQRKKISYYRNIVLTECAKRPSLYAFFKALQEDNCTDEKENESLKAKSEPLVLELGLLIHSIAEGYNMNQVIYKLGLSISKLQKEVEVEAQNDRLYRPLLLLVETAVEGVKIKQESPEALQLTLDNFIAKNGRLNADTAARYHYIGKTLGKLNNYDASLKSHYEALDIRLELYGYNHADTAGSYYEIGVVQLNKRDYESALQSFKQALDIRENLYGKIHLAVSRIYFCIGVTKYRLKEYDSAAHWHLQALDIRVALYGKEHPAVATSYYSIAECQCEIQDYDSALESCQQALDIRLELFGQESEDTSESYDQMELIRSLKKVCESSLELQSKNY